MKKILRITFLLLITIIVGACGNQNTSNEKSNSETDTENVSQNEVSTEEATSTESAEKVIVGFRPDNPPYGYLDDNDELTGYDYEILTKIDEALPQYEFQYDMYTWDSMLPTLDAGQIDIADSAIEWNEEREERYLFPEETYGVYEQFIVTLKDNDFDPQTLDDLAGHKVYSEQGDNSTAQIIKYNEENEEKIDAESSGVLSKDVLIQELINGNFEAAFMEPYEVQQAEEAHGDIFKVSEEPITSADTYFVFQKGSEDLQKAIDEQLRILKEDGTIDELYEKWFATE